MVKYQKKNPYQWKKSMVDEDEESGLDPFALIYGNSVWSSKRAKHKRFYIICISLASCSFILATLFLSLSPNFYSDKDGLASGNGFLCSSVPNGTICCDRRSRRSDVCVMKGDVRTHPASSSIILYPTNRPIDTLSSQSDGDDATIQHEKIRPYTRKWEKNVMDSVNELDLIVKKDSDALHRCDVHHDVPAVFFSTGGYTGNLYHEFNDGILPLYITSQHLNRKVVFVILEYHNWWITKYGDILSQLSDYPPIDFSGDKRVHCFPEAIVGLRIHDELSINPFLMEANQTRTIVDFHDMLDRAYWPRISGLIEDEEREREGAQPSLAMATDDQDLAKPKLVIISRNGSRSISNEASMVRIAERIGFKVELLRPEKTTELAKTYRALNSSDVMVGVHGAAMTHFLFMKPGSVFIQVVPLGLDWAAETYYGEPATRLGLRYIGYKILPKESSLYEDYNEDDPILMDPNSVNKKGWEFTKKIYLDRQNVKLDLRRFGKRLLHAYYYTKARKNGRLRRQLQ